MRKVAVVTGTRADYGLLYWIIKGIHEDDALELQLIVTGSHLSPEFGMTVREIESDGFPVTERVEMLLSSDTEEGIAISMGVGMIGLAGSYARLRPDILLLLGDRFEIHAAASAAVPFRIPVAHIHGGESTEGAIDELFRHSITKMSHLHFAATQRYADRIRWMGEAPDSIFVTGAPGLDNIRKLELLDKVKLAGELGIPAERQWGIMTFHSINPGKDMIRVRIRDILYAMKAFPDIFWVITYPNSDTGFSEIISEIKSFSESHRERAKLFISLGQLRFLSLLRNADIMIGNSSSGIIEAPSFELPVVNIGRRQEGRVRARNVIDIDGSGRDNIVLAINKALSPSFRRSLEGLQNPYGEGRASSAILRILREMDISTLTMKKGFVENV